MPYLKGTRRSYQKEAIAHIEDVIKSIPGLISLWSLNEESGTTVFAYPDPAMNGTHIDIEAQDVDMGYGVRGASYNNSVTNIWSSALQTAFDGSQGTQITFALSESGFWTDNTLQYYYSFFGDGNNAIRTVKNASNQFQLLYTAGSEADSVIEADTGTPTTLYSVTSTWSDDTHKDRIGLFINGDQTEPYVTNVGTWGISTLNSAATTIGATNTSKVGAADSTYALSAVFNWDLDPKTIARLRI